MDQKNASKSDEDTDLVEQDGPAKISKEAENTIETGAPVSETEDSTAGGLTQPSPDAKTSTSQATATTPIDYQPPAHTATNSEVSSMDDQMPATTSTGNYEDWIVMPDATWPPPIFMKKNVNPRERFYLEHRWHSQWSYYDSKATQNKNTYYWYQRIVVIGSLIIPALVSLNSTIARFITQFITPGDANIETMVRIGVDSITVFVSLAVAGSAALESLYKYGENWSSYRSAAEELQAEKNFYDMHAGPYANNATPFATFVERVEGVIANQNGKYFQAVQTQIANRSEDNDAIVDQYLGDENDEAPVGNTVSQTSIG